MSSCYFSVRTLRLRLKDRCATLLRPKALAVNQVWNYCNELSQLHTRRTGTFLSAYDMQPYTKGAGKELGLHSQTVQAIQEEYCLRRRQFKKTRLNWRVSNSKSARYSLGWVPFKTSALHYREGQVWFSGIERSLPLWDSYGLSAYAKDGVLGPGCFVEDARGRWYLCVQVKVPRKPVATSTAVVGIDLGSRVAAVTSDNARLQTKFYHALEAKLAAAQRANKKSRARAIHAKIRNQRKDALHQFTTALVNQYGAIFIGDVSSAWQIAMGNGKSVLDASWGELKTQLLYKGEHAGKWVAVVDESYSTQTCCHCGARTGPKGRAELNIRDWTCVECGAHLDRDINAAKNILTTGLLHVEKGVSRVGARREVKAAASAKSPTLNKVATAAARGLARLAGETPTRCATGKNSPALQAGG